MRTGTGKPLPYIFIIVTVGLLWTLLSVRKTERVERVNFSQFVALVREGQIRNAPSIPVTFAGNEVKGSYFRAETQSEHGFEAIIPKGSGRQIANTLVAQGVVVEIVHDGGGSSIFKILISVMPLLLIAAVGLFLMRRMRAPGGGALTFGKSPAQLWTPGKKQVTFKDVAGVEEAKEELQEIVQFLREPDKFHRLGGRLPRGVLLLGPPGTGKTLLARAVAGEADVSFYSVSASEFVEVFVGVGASRIRDLFKQGRQHTPCILFVDEIDAVGRQRGSGLGGGHDEKEQALNQLLVEMDGFESNQGVIVLAATNRPDVLDPALLRPGRFDRQVVVPLPDKQGREGILRVHTRRIPLSEDVDLALLARGTSGFSGAQLANMANEAALGAARCSLGAVTMADFEEARDRSLMGRERKSLVISKQEKRSTAYHEAGHALVAHMLPEADPLHKVTIVPRGRTLGTTAQLPEDDVSHRSQEYVETLVATLLAGRCAEEMFLGQFTTGSSDDLQRVTELARRMVCEWGMSAELGPLYFGQDKIPVFLGREVARRRPHSQQTVGRIDQEIKKVVLEAYGRVRHILQVNRKKLVRLAEALLETETLDLVAFEAIVGARRSASTG